jgi:hypothetical protein
MYAKSTNRDNCDKGTLSKKKKQEKKRTIKVRKLLKCNYFSFIKKINHKKDEHAFLHILKLSDCMSE